MNSQAHPTNTISIRQIADHINNDNFENEILIFNNVSTIKHEDSFTIRIDALLFGICTEGTATLGIDLQEYHIQKNTLFTIQPRNYISLIDASPDFTCNFIACSHHVVEDVIPKLTDILPLLIHNRTEPVVLLSDEAVKNLNLFYSFLRETVRGPHTPFQKQKILCMLQAALYEMMDINLQSKENEKTTLKTRKEEIMASFILAVSENFRNERQVIFYANKLCITPKHLSAVVKEISGRTAGEWIENYVIMEAKVLLKTTDMTIQEIANYLNFANQSFFGKYFKHHTGYSPTNFRKKFA